MLTGSLGPSSEEGPTHVPPDLTDASWRQGVYYGVAMGAGNLGMLTVLYYGGQFVNQVGSVPRPVWGWQA
jgi:hypothetical protein